MAVPWTLTVDCADAVTLAAFWREALGYAEAPPPTGFESWEQWLRRFKVPESEWDDGRTIVDPAGQGPRICFLQVPEPKVAKNRLHLDLQVGGGRHLPWQERWSRVSATVERLTAAGASIVREDTIDGEPDHVVMADPEGNEFCVV